MPKSIIGNFKIDSGLFHSNDDDVCKRREGDARERRLMQEGEKYTLCMHACRK